MEPSWGRHYTVTLPSGHVVVARRISLVSLLWSGGFPNELTSVVWRMFNQQEIDIAKAGQDPEALRKMVGIVEQVVPHVLVQPKVGETTVLEAGPGNEAMRGTVALADIPDIDKQWLLLFGQGLIRTAEERAAEPGAPAGPEGFRDESVRPDAGPAGAAVRTAPLGDGRATAPEPAGA